MKVIKFKKIINIIVCILVVFSIFMAIFALKTFKTKTPDNPITDNVVQSVIQNISQSKRGSSTENSGEKNKIPNEKITEPTESREENSKENTDNPSQEIPQDIRVDYIILPKGNVVAVDNNHEASNVPGNNRKPNNYNSNASNNNSNGGGNTNVSENTLPISTNPVAEPTDPTIPVDSEDIPSFETNIENNAELNSKDYSFKIKHLNDRFTPIKTFVYVNDALVPQFNGNILLDYGENTVKIIVSYKDENGKITNVFKGYTLFVKSPEIKINTDLSNKTVNTSRFSFTASALSDISVPLNVTLNGEAVSGDISYHVKLKEGDNSIKLTAKAYGKERQENYTVTYVKPEKAVLRTNLNNNETVNAEYINFEAYIDGGSDKAKLEVRVNDNLITGNDYNYTANLQIGINTIRFTIMDGGTKERYIYNVNYRPVTTPETEPYITYINFTDGINLKGSQFRLIVTAADYKGNKIYAGTDANNGMAVTLNNGGILTPSGTDEYFLFLQSGKNTITIKLTDEIGYTATYEYTIYCQKVNKGDPIGTVTISLDAKTLGLDYIIEPDTVTIYEGKSIAETLVEFIENYGIDCEYSNTYDTGFYLQRIHQANIAQWAEIPQELVNELNNDGITWTDSKVDSIGEQDFTRSSGWMYNINGIYVNHGFSDCILKDGDVVELRYTLALGKDIGAAKSTGESGGNYSKVW